MLRGAAAGLAGLSLAPLAAPIARAQGTPIEIDDVENLSHGLTVLTGLGGNVVSLRTSEGTVLVDSAAPTMTSRLLDLAEKVTGDDRVHALFNTHWHSDQVGGNEHIGGMGARIIAHEKTRLRLSTPVYQPAEDRYQPALPVRAQPTESFYTTGDTTIGGRHIEYGHLLEAHTDGDAYVYFRDANVIAVGDAVSPHRDIELDWWGGGWLGGRLDSLKQLLELTNAQTKFVPSYGDTVGRVEVQAEHDLCLLLFERFLERIRKGESNEDMLAAGIMENTGRTWNDPAKFVHDAHKGFWAHYNTLSHDIV